MDNFTNEGLQDLHDELNKTAVLSDPFKERLLILAMKACRIAFENGAKKQEVVNTEG